MDNQIKVLIIDDNESILSALSAICEFKDWIPITAIDVESGITRFNKEKPDIVLIDYHMKIINGLVGVRLLRSISTSVPIIVLTVDEKQETADAFIEAGASDFALKPIKAPDLISRINVHLKLAKHTTKTQDSYKEYAKGINLDTLELIEKTMKEIGDFTTISKVSKESGLAYQTVHRYFQHLIDHDVLEVRQHYGKVGRPKSNYRWADS